MTLSMSSGMGVTSSLWLTIWVSIELNTLAMCYVLTKEQIKHKIKNNVAMTYFIVQIMASSLMLVIMLMSSKGMYQEVMLSLTIIVKMGSWPFHLWYLKLLYNVSMKENSMWILMTWQKLLPMLLLLMVNKEDSTKMMLVVLALMSVMAPFSMLKKMKNKKVILALSSLNSNGWLILVSVLDLSMGMKFLLMYMVTLMITIPDLSASSYTKENSFLESLKSTGLMANLSSLPPSPMFWMKVLVIMKIAKDYGFYLVATALLVMSCAMAFLYMNMFYPSMMVLAKKMNNSYEKKMPSTKMAAIVLVIIFVGLLGTSQLH